MASMGITAMAVVICALAASTWWIVRSQRAILVDHRTQQIQLAAQRLAHEAQAAMALRDVPLLQQLVTAASKEYSFARCGIVMPKGQVVADSQPNRVTANRLPEKWSTDRSLVATESRDAGRLTLRCPLEISGRGNATLEIVAPLDGHNQALVSTFIGLSVIGAAGLGVLLILFGLARPHLRTLEAIRRALRVYQGDQTPIELMGVSPKFGADAVAWNDLLAGIQKLRKTKLVEESKESLGTPQRVASNLDEACNTMSQGMVLLDETLNIRYANGAAAVFAKADRQAMIGTSIAQYFEATNVKDAIQSAADASLRRRSVVEVRQGGENDFTVLRFGVRPVRRSDPGAVMIVVDDVTQQRVAEQARNDFVTQVAHELRTPLSNIRLYIESLLDDELDEATQSKAINVINIETKRLARLVSDMLSVAEIEAGSMQVQSDDLHLDVIFQEMESDYKVHAGDKNLQLTFSLPEKLPVIQADRDKLVMAMHNLVGNAVKYTPDGGQVDVSVDVSADQFVMEVSDTGIGISQEDQSRIFEKFYRARDEQMIGIPGTGLGLSLAREVVRLHGGDIGVESEKGKGTTFTLSLPIRNAAA